MDVEGSHETPQAPAPAPAPAPQASNRSTMGSQQMKILLVVVVLAAVAVGAWLAFGRSTHKKKTGNITTAIGPKSLSADGLRAQAARLATPLYWIGPKKGYRYEFTRTTKGRLFIRYLPKGVGARRKQGQLLVVATYPWTKPYKALHKAAKGRGISGPGGSFIIPARPGDTKSVLVAYPHGAVEIEVYEPVSGKAQTIAASGKLTTVG